MSDEEKRTDFYDQFLGIRFTENLDDSPDGYDVGLGIHHFYLPSRILPELTRPDMETGTLMSRLTNINETVPVMMRQANISPEQVHIAFLKVGLLRIEKERDYFISKNV